MLTIIIFSVHNAKLFFNKTQISVLDKIRLNVIKLIKFHKLKIIFI